MDAPTLFRHFAPDGHVLSSRLVSADSQITWVHAPLWYAASGLLPLASLPFINVMGQWFFSPGATYAHPLWWPSAISALMMIIIVPVIARRRRLPASEARWWYLWCVAFGPAAVLAMLFQVRPRPALRCASCHGWREIALTTCPQCGAPWPMPHDARRMILDPAA